jgi:hypothetical protein
MTAGEAASEGANLLTDADAKDGRTENGAKTDLREPEPATSDR